ncbi:galanin receptor 2a-like [Montipora capricornis]|uniref:galanin receptor 2a-like n=1 Tax=Montipora capricornis TaxID=246305 RepID=UPI0035F182E7
METFITVTLTLFPSVLLILNLLGNIIVIVVICKNKSLQNANTLLLSNLALADVIFTVQGFVEIMIVLYNDEDYVPSLFIVRALVSIFTLAALSIERYFAILKPFVYLAKAAKSLLCKVILVTWVLAGVLGVPGIYIEVFNIGNHEETGNATMTISTWRENFNVIYSFVLLVSGFIVPSAVIIFCYARVICHLWFDTEASEATQIVLFKSRRKLTKLFIIVTAIFLVTWCPNFTMRVVKQFVSDSDHKRRLKLSSIVLAMAGSTANPVLYSFRSPNFRREVTKLFKCCTCCKRRRPNFPKINATNSYTLTQLKKKEEERRTINCEM